MNKLLKTTGIIVALAFFLMPSFVLANAVVEGSINDGLEDTLGVLDGDPFRAEEVGANPSAFLSSQVGSIIGIILSFVGVIFLILIIAGGLGWMFSGGNDEKIKKSRGMLVSAIMGLFIVFAAYAITAFIGNILTGN